MTKRKILIAVLSFVVYLALAFVGAWFLAPASFSLVFFVLAAVGLTVLIVYLLIARLTAQSRGAAASSGQGGPPGTDQGTAPTRSVGSDDAELQAFGALITEADQRLAKSPKLASRRVKTTVTGLPLFLIGGTEGSGKTSTFLKSGLEPELLAGQVFRDANIVPTRLANLWYAEDCLFAELSGTLFSGDSGRWAAILARLQGRSAGGFLKRIFGGKTDAQLRGFVLLVDVTPFLGVPDSSRLGGLSRRIQERLRLVGESFGTNFPVYVVFTKSDTLPYFTEYFARLVENEDQQILGCTLPAVAPGARPAGEVYAEAETGRLSDAFNGLYYSLAEKRLTVLPRETDAVTRPAAYEFPREIKRVKDTLVQFLVDVFRPNPLQPGPILRGYYFTGTRKVSVSALGPVANDPVARASAGEATSLFNLADYQKKMGLTPEASSSPVETTVQRWCFVAELFHRVVLPDPMGQAVAFASTRQAKYKRIAFGALALFAFLVCILWLRSWYNNGSLLGDVQTASQSAYTFQPGVRAVPSLDTLNGMEALRTQLDTLLTYDRDGAPWRMRWGLYAGGRVLPSAYHLYFQRFRQVFFDEILASLSGTLLRLPSTPDAQNSYNATYDRLKAYRMIAQCKCTPDPAFLTKILADTWLTGRNMDDTRQALVLKQLAFYANELKIQNPYPAIQENNDAVKRGQMYLASIGGVERLYRGIIEAANKSPQNPARLADIAPNYKEAINSSPGEVQAAFTKDGWNFVNAAIKDPSNLKLGDPCVVGAGNAGAQLLQGAQMQTDLQNLYIRDYIRAWKDFAASTTVAPYANVADAAKKLEILASNRTPLLAAIFMIAQNTNFPPTPGASPAAAALVNKVVPAGAKKAMDTAKQAQALLGPAQTATPGDIGRLFQPARAVVVVDNPDRLINEPNQAYMTALDNLRVAMGKLKDDRPSNPDPALNKQADDAVNAGLSQVTALTQKFNTEASDLRWLLDSVNSDKQRDGVDVYLKRLLEAPFKDSQRFIITDMGKVTAQRANGAMKTFCARLAPVQNKFPFNPSSETDAPVAEVTAIFSPQTGALATLQQQLGKLIVKQGARWAANPESQDAHPTPDFLNFLNKMQQIQDALFENGSPALKMDYSLRPLADQVVEAVTLDIDGHKFTAGKDAKPEPLSWPGSGQVVASVKASGDRAFGYYSGPWAVLRWMYDSDPRAGGSNIVQWSTTRQSHGQPQPAGTDAQGRPIVLRVEISKLPAGVDVFERNFFSVRCPSKAAE